MNVITIKEKDLPRWESYIEGCKRTVAWQSYRWKNALDRNYGVEFFPLAAENNGDICGILPLYRIKSKSLAANLISVPYAVAGGLSADSAESEKALLSEAVELSKQLESPGITFKQYRYPLKGSLRTDSNFFNRELSLDTEIDQIWEQLDTVNKKNIESARGEKYEVEYPCAEVDVFYNLLLQSMTRSGIPCPSRKWVRTLLGLDMYRIAMLRYNGRPLAATMVKEFKTTVSFPFSCMKGRSERAVQSTYFLYWELIQQFARSGFQIFHSGRMPKNEDVEVYRRGWGGIKHPYYYQYYPDTKGLTEYSTKRGWKRRLFISCWKRMPKKVSETIGPRIVAKFP